MLRKLVITTTAVTLLSVGGAFAQTATGENPVSPAEQIVVQERFTDLNARLADLEWRLTRLRDETHTENPVSPAEQIVVNEQFAAALGQRMTDLERELIRLEGGAENPVSPAEQIVVNEQSADMLDERLTDFERRLMVLEGRG